MERVGRVYGDKPRQYDPIHEHIKADLLSVLAVLKYATTGSRGITFDLRFNPKRTRHEMGKPPRGRRRAMSLLFQGVIRVVVSDSQHEAEPKLEVRQRNRRNDPKLRNNP